MLRQNDLEQFNAGLGIQIRPSVCSSAGCHEDVRKTRVSVADLLLQCRSLYLMLLLQARAYILDTSGRIRILSRLQFPVLRRFHRRR